MIVSAVVRPAAAGLPILARGRHSHPEEGACLLEYTSVLAGHPFSDHPRCTAPVLATLGRLVNDTVSDVGRHELARLAPDLAARPQVPAGATASLVARVLSDVASAVGASGDPRRRRTARWLQIHAGWEFRRARAASRQRSAWWVRLAAVAHRNGAARLRLEYAIRASTSLDDQDRDQLLLSVLETAVASVPGIRGPRHLTARAAGGMDEDLLGRRHFPRGRRAVEAGAVEARAEEVGVVANDGVVGSGEHVGFGAGGDVRDGAGVGFDAEVGTALGVGVGSRVGVGSGVGVGSEVGPGAGGGPDTGEALGSLIVEVLPAVPAARPPGGDHRLAAGRAGDEASGAAGRFP